MSNFHTILKPHPSPSPPLKRKGVSAEHNYGILIPLLEVSFDKFSSDSQTFEQYSFLLLDSFLYGLGLHTIWLVIFAGTNYRPKF